MRWPGWLTRVLPVLRGREARADLDAELRLHLDLETRRQEEGGVSGPEAVRRAHVKLGNRSLIVEDTGAVWRLGWFDDLRRDVRLAIRLLATQWRFTALAVSILALGIGANTAVFGLANAVLLKPLPVQDPDRLVRLFGNSYSNISYAIYQDYRDRAVTLSGLSAFEVAPVSARIDDGAETLQGRFVSGNYFQVLGVDPAVGRAIQPDDEHESGSAPVAVLSHDYWHRRFAGDPEVVGRPITINGQLFTIVGVGPPAFRGTMVPFALDVWLPFHAPGGPAGGPSSVLVIGRLAEGVGVAAARAEVTTLHDGLRRDDPERHPFQTMSLYAASGVHPEIARMVTPFVAALVGLAALVLLVACLNLASLQLAKSTSRGREIGIRLALGAGRGRVVRQLLTEGVLLAAAGTAAGLVIAAWVTRSVSALTFDAPLPISVVFDMAFDWRVFAFAAGLAVVSVLVFGLSPTMRVSRTNPITAVKGERPMMSPVGRSRSRALLIAGQLGVSVVLLAATGLLLQSWRNLATVDLGFNPDRVVAVQLDLEPRGDDDDQMRRLYRRLTERLSTVPAVRAVSLVDIVPLTFSNQAYPLLPDQQVDPPREQLGAYRVSMNSVTPSYFRTVGIPLLRGRDFSNDDVPGAVRVAVINQTLANRYWPGEDPLGRRLRPFGREDDAAFEVVGVVGDARYTSVGERQTAFAYLSLAQNVTRQFSILVQGGGDPVGLIPGVRQAIDQIDPALSVLSAHPLSALTGLTVLPLTAAGSLAGGFGLLVLSLAAIGIYGVLSQIVASRTRELGIRMALGARASAVAGLVLGQSLRWLLGGLAGGLVCAALVTRLIGGLLYGVSPTDPLAFIGAAVTLLAVGVAASLGPVRRAVRTSPMTALRTE